jgi:hypothetical protein
MNLDIQSTLRDLGFIKKAEYDPTATHQTPDTTSVYKKINHIPTPISIDMLGKE